MPTQQWPDPDFSAKPAVRDDIELPLLPPKEECLRFGHTTLALQAYARAAILADRARQAPAPVEVSRLAEELAEEIKTAWGRQDNVRLYKATDKLRDLACAASTPVGEVPADDTMDMALCEIHSVVIRPGQRYTFSRVGDCEKCAAMEREAIEAYGEPANRPVGRHREVEALRADAERYRFWRLHARVPFAISGPGTLKFMAPKVAAANRLCMPEAVDAAIDTARASTDEGVARDPYLQTR